LRLRATVAYRVLAAGAATVLLAYTLTVYVANGLPILVALAVATANTIPVILFGVPVFIVARDRLRERKFSTVLAAHVGMCAVFSLLSYWLLMVMLGVIHGVSPTEFSVHPFTNRNMAWQLLENATLYGLVAALGTLQSRPRSVTLIVGAGGGQVSEGTLGTGRYLIRSGDEIRPIIAGSIVSISGADDYSEIVTSEGRHLVRMTLGEFERSLDPAKFIRIHRSRIINIERIERAEPAGGGRLFVYMEDGEMIAGSRAGSRLLRDAVI